MTVMDVCIAMRGGGFGMYLKKDLFLEWDLWLSLVFRVAFALPDTNQRRGVC